MVAKLGKAVCNCAVRLILAAGVALVSALTTCGADEATPFKVGAIIPLTGPLADYGQSLRKSFEYARKTNATRFKNIEFTYEDSAYDGKTALSALQSLLSRGDIDLLYTWGVSPNESLLPVTNERKIPVLAETSLKAAVVGKPYAVRAAPTGEMTAHVLASEIRRRGHRSVGIVLVDIPYYRDVLATLKSVLTAHGISLEIAAEVGGDASDFNSIITKIRGRAYDVVGVFLLNDQIVTWYKQSVSLNARVPTFGAGIHDSQELLNRCGPGAEGAFFAGYDVEEKFHTEWLQEFKDDSRIGAIANAYDTALLVADLFGDGRSSDLSADEIISRLTSVGPKRGVSGSFSFREAPDTGKSFDFPVSLRIVRGGRIVRP